MGNLKARGFNRFISYDAVAMATLLRPDCILATDFKYCTLELRGELTRGMMVVDWRHHLGKEPNVHLIRKLDADIVSRLLHDCIMLD